MPHAIIRGKNGRCHKVDFGDAPIRVEVHANEQVVEISIEAYEDPAPSGKRRFALLDLYRATSLARPWARRHNLPTKTRHDLDNA